MAILRDGQIQSVKKTAEQLGLTVTGYHTVQIDITVDTGRLLDAIKWLIYDDRKCVFDYYTQAPTQQQLDSYLSGVNFQPKYAFFHLTDERVAVDFKLRFG